MTTLNTQSFSPFAGLFPELNRLSPLLDTLLREGPLGASLDAPVRLNTTDEAVHVTVELPGVEPADLDLSVEGATLTLRGRRTAPDSAETTVHRRERPQGEFHFGIDLPYDVEAAKAAASLRHGILTVTLPRAEADRPRRIAIQN
jgi:HSP20 family protein